MNNRGNNDDINNTPSDEEIDQLAKELGEMQPKISNEEMNELLKIVDEMSEYAKGRKIPEISNDQLIADLEAHKEKEEERQWLADLLTELESEPSQQPNTQTPEAKKSTLQPENKKESKSDKLLGKDQSSNAASKANKTSQSEFQNGDIILFKPGKPEKLIDKIADVVINAFQKIKKSSREDAAFVHAGIVEIDKYGTTNVIHFTNQGPVKTDIRDITEGTRYKVGANLRCDDAAKAQEIARNASSALESHADIPQRYSFGKAIKTLFQSSKISRETAANIEREVKNQQICSSFCMDVVNKTLGKDQTKHHATVLPGELRSALESANFTNVAKQIQRAASRSGLQDAYKKIQEKVIDPIKAIANRKTAAPAPEPDAPDAKEKTGYRPGGR